MSDWLDASDDEGTDEVVAGGRGGTQAPDNVEATRDGRGGTQAPGDAAADVEGRGGTQAPDDAEHDVEGRGGTQAPDDASVAVNVGGTKRIEARRSITDGSSKRHKSVNRKVASAGSVPCCAP